MLEHWSCSGLEHSAKNAFGEQSAAYKTAFALQKSFAVASATLAMGQAMSKGVEKGFPEGLPFILQGAAEGARILEMITSTGFSGAYDKGGRIPAGQIGLVGEYGPEFVRGPVDVTSRQDTARIRAGGGSGESSSGGGGAMSVRVVNYTDMHAAATDWASSRAGERAIINVMKNNPGVVRSLAR